MIFTFLSLLIIRAALGSTIVSFNSSPISNLCFSWRFRQEHCERGIFQENVFGTKPMIMSTDMIRCPSLVIEGFMMNNTLVGVVSPTDSSYDLGDGNVTLLNANISFTVILSPYEAVDGTAIFIITLPTYFSTIANKNG